jgi:hypothetical protein
MRKFWEDKRKVRNEKETITDYERIDNQKQQELNKIQQELDCEQAIINEKETFGRVRTTMMKYLRTKYGQELTNRIQWRINKRQNKNKVLRN